jgi:hypothetical protein
MGSHDDDYVALELAYDVRFKELTRTLTRQDWERAFGAEAVAATPHSQLRAVRKRDREDVYELRELRRRTEEAASKTARVTDQTRAWVGKWAVVYDGQAHGPYDTRDEARDAIEAARRSVAKPPMQALFWRVGDDGEPVLPPPLLLGASHLTGSTDDGV